MFTSAFPTLVECPSDLPDPRLERTRLHSLLDILEIAKREWLQGRLELHNGIPSAETFRRVFARLQPRARQTCFRLWPRTLHQLTEGETISLDSKVLRHSSDLACGQSAIHVVSAWAASTRLVLEQLRFCATSPST